MSSITDTRTQMLGKQGKRKAENPLLNDATSKRAKKAVSSFKIRVRARDIDLRQKVFRPQVLFPNCGSNSRPIATIDDPEVEQHDVRPSSNGLRKSSSGRGKRISSSFEATGVLCGFPFYSTVMLNHLFVNRSTTQLCIR